MGKYLFSKYLFFSSHRLADDCCTGWCFIQRLRVLMVSTLHPPRENRNSPSEFERVLYRNGS